MPPRYHPRASVTVGCRSAQGVTRWPRQHAARIMPGGDGATAAQLSPDAASISPPRQRHGRVPFRAAGDALASPACSPDHAGR
ncbi:hypothetical protein QPR65_22755 (plasmid) [Enterobacter hormaechei]|uniref:hypothetical protein n=1 Tax=Enterobacter hormaechei TaxID=158836 RepID=UPI0027D31577|nr:hypothetical protein [Enterobacter hormaechei]WLZ51957.1 hypothetical protein QPR65_22755 [Enterobacter hormaechei]